MKLNKKYFEKVAQMLPKRVTYFTNSRIVTGAEILSWNTIKKIDNEPIQANKQYIYNEPVYHEHNHAKALFKAYCKGGISNVNHYIEQVISKAEQSNKEAQTIGVFKLVTEKIKADLKYGKY
jgi:hypothetical protein